MEAIIGLTEELSQQIELEVQEDAKIKHHDLYLLKKYRDFHCSNGEIKNARYDVVNSTLRNEINRLNLKIRKEIEDHEDYQESEYDDDDNQELMIENEDRAQIYSWMKKLLLEKWKKNVQLQERAFNKFVKETEQLFRMEQCGRMQLNLEEAEDFRMHENFNPIIPEEEHELDEGITSYRIRMRVFSPPASATSSSEEDEDDN